MGVWYREEIEMGFRHQIPSIRDGRLIDLTTGAPCVGGGSGEYRLYPTTTLIASSVIVMAGLLIAFITFT